MVQVENVINAYEGKVFIIMLKSMASPTGYGWTLTSLPEGIAFITKEITPIKFNGIAPKNEIFYFCALKGVSQGLQQIGFTMVCIHNPRITTEKVNVKIIITPADENSMDDFVEYSEGQASYNMAIPYGYAGETSCIEVYGYPCYVNAVLKYGYPGSI